MTGEPAHPFTLTNLTSHALFARIFRAASIASLNARPITQTGIDDHASLPQPYLRPVEENRRRRVRPPVGLGAPRARPWRPAVHRSARPLRPDPDRRRSGFAGLQDGRDRARRMGDPRRRRGQGARRRDRQRQPADRRDRDLRARDRSAVGGQGTAAAGVRRARLSRGHPPEIPLPRPAPRHAAQEHRGAHEDHRRDAQAHGGGGLHRIFDADPDGFLARRRARLPGAVAASIPASSTRCRRRRSSTSS